MHESQPMQRACDKYGLPAFSFSMIEYVDLRERLLEREQCWIDFFKPRYNTAKFAGHPTLGLKHSDETKAKMSASRKGKKRPPFSEEWLKNLRETRRLRQNVISDEGREKIRQTQLGNKHSLGHYPSEETRRKLSLSRMGNKNALGFKYPPEAYESRRKKRK